MKLFIHAPNIHCGGGAVLLDDLLRAIPGRMAAAAVLDERMIVSAGLPGHVDIQRVRPSIGDRLSAEAWLSRHVSESDRVLCFGNLPPLFPSRGDVSVFLQNRYLIDDEAPLGALPLKSRLRLKMERAWLVSRRGNARRYFVQTPSMQRLAERQLGMRVTCVPFVPEGVLGLASSRHPHGPHRFDFLYVASGEAHKNHATLIRAWAILADEGLFPSLALTLSGSTAPGLVRHIEAQRASRGLDIHNLGVLPHDQVVGLYRESRALIYPSTFESFGLPLVEAKLAGLPVLAPELDYVRDVTDPAESFDPRSPVSIARAVKRFLQGGLPPVEPGSARILLDRLAEEASS